MLNKPFAHVIGAKDTECKYKFLLVSLGKTVVPNSTLLLISKTELEKFMKPWKKYVDGTITDIKPNFITAVVNILSKFHKNIKFLYEVEQIGNMQFLDFLSRVQKLETTVFCKETNNNSYVH